MEKAFQELLRLIGEAADAWKCGCVVTTRAYLKMAKAATAELLAYAIDEDEYKRLREARNYSEHFCFLQENWEEVVCFMTNFWLGVNDGFFDNTLTRSGGYYERGYKMARYFK